MGIKDEVSVSNPIHISILRDNNVWSDYIPDSPLWVQPYFSLAMTDSTFNRNCAGCWPNTLIWLTPKMFEFHYPRQPANDTKPPEHVGQSNKQTNKNIINSYCIWTCTHSLSFRKMQRLKNNPSVLCKSLLSTQLHDHLGFDCMIL